MKYNPLGRTGISVSEICLGTMTWGSQNSEAEAHEQLDYALDHGVSFIDTAELYPTTPAGAETYGDTERFIGSWIAARGGRDQYILASKVAGPGRPYIRGGAPASRAGTLAAIDGSLSRLRTDYLDLYQLHWPNRAHYHFRAAWDYAPWRDDRQRAQDEMLELLETLGDLVKAGKVRAVGLSNETAWGTMQFLRLSEEKGLPRMASVQNEYNLLYRSHDLDMAELSHHEDVGLLAYSPLAVGLLSGQYLGGACPEGSRRTKIPDLGGRYATHQEAAVRAYVGLAGEHGLDPAQMALAFCLTRPFVTSVIIGARTMDQLKADIAAADLTLSQDVMSGIARIHRMNPAPM